MYVVLQLASTIRCGAGSQHQGDEVSVFPPAGQGDPSPANLTLSNLT